MLFLYSILTDPFLSHHLLFVSTYSFVVQNTYLIISRDKLKPLLKIKLNYISTDKYLWIRKNFKIDNAIRVLLSHFYNNYNVYL